MSAKCHTSFQAVSVYTNIVRNDCDVCVECVVWVLDCGKCAQIDVESTTVICVYVCVWVGACVHVCTRPSTSLIQRGINPIHYLAGLRAAQSMALSVAADELPSLTRCIIQTCRRARLCLAFQSTKET